MGLLGLVSLSAFYGLQEASGQGQTPGAALQDDLGPAAPIAAQDAPDQTSASGYLCVPTETALECMGKWAPMFTSLHTVFNARVRWWKTKQR